MATLVKETYSKDSRGFVSTEQVYEAFDGHIAPDSGARSWVQSVSDGKYTLTQTFTDEIPNPDPGGGGPPQVFPDTWSIEVSTSSEPIENHPIFATVSAAEWAQVSKWKRNPNDSTLEPPGWTPASAGPTGAKFEQLFNRGNTTFLSPRIVFKHTYTATSPPNLGDVGQISFPSFASGIGPAGVNYILTGATCVSEGSNYKVSLEWLGSALGGWDPDLYYGTQ
jgi:hypothetical protein